MVTSSIHIHYSAWAVTCTVLVPSYAQTRYEAARGGGAEAGSHGVSHSLCCSTEVAKVALPLPIMKTLRMFGKMLHVSPFFSHGNLPSLNTCRSPPSRASTTHRPRAHPKVLPTADTHTLVHTTRGQWMVLDGLRHTAVSSVVFS